MAKITMPNKSTFYEETTKFNKRMQRIAEKAGSR
jgi:hypothetical protein